MISIELLISTMHQKDYSLLNKMNINSDAVVINQCDEDSYNEFNLNGNHIVWINSTERGLSKSRNLAIKNSNADVCLICDDDEILKSNYTQILITAYSSSKDADVIVFNLELLDYNIKERLFNKVKRIPKHKTYGSVHMSFKRKSIVENNICFNVDFGTGSGKYSSGEDNIFFMECHKKKLKCYTYPAIIGSVSYQESTWFKGYTKQYFYDIGAFLSVAYPKLKYIYKWYYPIRFIKLSNLKWYEIIKNINCGIKGYKSRLNFEEYNKKDKIKYDT